MVFNVGMESQTHPDAKLIGLLGGPAKVAELLSYHKAGGVQRVHNWLVRGIPAAVKVQRPDLFLTHSKQPKPGPIPADKAA